MKTVIRLYAVAGIALAATFLGSLATAGETSIPPTPLTIKQLMEGTLTPATDILWGLVDSPTDEEWKKLEQAATTALAAAQLTAQGGAGEHDNEWVKQPLWQALNKTMTTAAKDALQATQEKNYDKFLEATDALYPPCEACHKQFNPGVAGEQDLP